MKKLKQRLQVLALFSIYFIYKSISALVENNLEEMSLWGMITLVYIISLVIAYFILRGSQKTLIESKVLMKKGE